MKKKGERIQRIRECEWDILKFGNLRKWKMWHSGSCSQFLWPQCGELWGFNGSTGGGTDWLLPLTCAAQRRWVRAYGHGGSFLSPTSLQPATPGPELPIGDSVQGPIHSYLLKADSPGGDVTAALSDLSTQLWSWLTLWPGAGQGQGIKGPGVW